MVHCKQGLVSVLAIVLVHPNLYHFVFTTPWFGKGGRPHIVYVKVISLYYGKVSEPSRM